MRLLSYLITLTFILSVGQLSAQFPVSDQGKELAEDNNVLFIKANVLFDSDRYDEAVRMYNRILKDDQSFSRALFMRGKAKFALGAFKGTKSDMIDYMDQKGINIEWLEIMAQTEKMLENPSNALSYLDVLTKVKPFEGKNFHAAAELYYELDDRNKACEYWIKSAKLGDSEGAKYASMKCDYNESIHLPTKSHTKANNEQASSDDQNTWVSKDAEEAEENEKRDSVLNGDKLKVVDVSVKTTSPDVDMNATQEHKIDEELTVVLNSGLGARKVDNIPNILILSDQSGKVILDLCIDSDGTVKSAVLNKKLTTIFRSSLTSLVIRKAKDFVFMPSLVEEQCGLMIFDIQTD